MWTSQKPVGHIDPDVQCSFLVSLDLTDTKDFTCFVLYIKEGLVSRWSFELS